MSTQEEYKVDLEVFEGPLDLLLYLIKKEEVDIYNIPIERVTTQYMEYLRLMRMLDLNIAGEFIVMAATLMLIKSRMLLPVEEREEIDEEEDDPRWELVRQLVEYKKFKDAASRLHEREVHQEDVFPLGAENVVLEPVDPGVVLSDVSLFDLISSFNDVLKNAKQEEIGEIIAERFTVADKIDAILNMVVGQKSVSFTGLFGEKATRHEIICTFLGLLELIRLRHVSIRQTEHFGEIEVCGLAAENIDRGLEPVTVSPDDELSMGVEDE
jgi:segregation and condensation protein A